MVRHFAAMSNICLFDVRIACRLGQFFALSRLGAGSFRQIGGARKSPAQAGLES
jgi:hypothetical protein